MRNSWRWFFLLFAPFLIKIHLCRPHKQRADVLEINGPERLNLAIFHTWLIYHVWCCYVSHWIWPFFLLRLETFWFTLCRIWCRFPWKEPIRKIKYNRVSLQNYSFCGLRRAQCTKACLWKTCQRSFGNKLYFTYITLHLARVFTDNCMWKCLITN